MICSCLLCALAEGRGDCNLLAGYLTLRALFDCHCICRLQIDNLDPRGVQVAALFMSGVDMALFANDVCGQPIPWEHCCPWMYFDGKLLQSKLIRANRDKAQLIDLCDGQV